MRSRRGFVAFVAFAALSWVCSACVSDQASYGSGSGELGKGSLLVACSEADAVCEPGAPSLPPGAPLAVGASFAMSYAGQVPSAPNGPPTTMTLFSAAPDLLSGDAAELVAWKPGLVAVLARTAEGTVTDFIHLEVAPIARIEVHRSDEGTGDLSVGEQREFSATPRTKDDRLLGGGLAYTWEVQGAAVEIVAGEGRTATVRAIDPGTATLVARSGSATGETTIVVEGAP